MKAAIDVHYENDKSIAACVIFKKWEDSGAFALKRIILPPSKDYCPGKFYLRELPCILELLKHIEFPLDTIIVDGYVHLKKGKGLGAYLFEFLPYRCCIIGVAKNPLKIADKFIPILRGGSKKPLFISSMGCSLKYASKSICAMYGTFRIPRLLKIADQLARGLINIQQ